MQVWIEHLQLLWNICWERDHHIQGVGSDQHVCKEENRLGSGYLIFMGDRIGEKQFVYDILSKKKFVFDQ